MPSPIHNALVARFFQLLEVHPPFNMPNKQNINMVHFGGCKVKQGKSLFR
jgi:hypothetical protein